MGESIPQPGNTRTLPEAPALARARLAAQAVKDAMAGRWEDACVGNRRLLDLNPNDIDALLRLGKALGELGRYRDACDCFERVLSLDHANRIARKNVDRLTLLLKDENGTAEATAIPRAVIDPGLLIEESGKTVLVSPEIQGGIEILARLSAGEKLEVAAHDGRVVLVDYRGVTIGIISGALGDRLSRLIVGGNRYVAGVVSVKPGLRVLVREIYRNPALPHGSLAPVSTSQAPTIDLDALGDEEETVGTEEEELEDGEYTSPEDLIDSEGDDERTEKVEPTISGDEDLMQSEFELPDADGDRPEDLEMDDEDAESDNDPIDPQADPEADSIEAVDESDSA